MRRIAILGVLIVAGVLVAPALAFTGTCTYFVGSGNCGGTTGTGAITSAGSSTGNYKLRDRVIASVSSIPANAHLIVWYQSSSGTTIYTECGNGVNYCVRNADSPWPAKAGCAVSAPPPPRSISGYCRTDW